MIDTLLLPVLSCLEHTSLEVGINVGETHRPKVDILDHQPPTVSKIRTHSSKCRYGISKILTHISTEYHICLPVFNWEKFEICQFRSEERRVGKECRMG